MQQNITVALYMETSIYFGGKKFRDVHSLKSCLFFDAEKTVVLVTRVAITTVFYYVIL